MTHDDGTPMSTDNDFCWNNGQPSIFLQDSFFNKSATNQRSSIQAVAKARAENRDTSTIYGVSKKADAMVYEFKKLMFSVHIATREESDRTQSIRNRK